MRPTTIAATLIIVACVLAVMLLAKDMVIPFAMAVVCWFMVNTINAYLLKLFKKPTATVRNLTLFTSVVLFIGAFVGVITLVAHNAVAMVEIAPQYQHKFESLLQNVSTTFNISIPDSNSIMESVNISTIVSETVNSITTIAGNLMMILIYLAFLLLEQRLFWPKLKSLSKRYGLTTDAEVIVSEVRTAVQKYLIIKTFTSFLTGILSYVALVAIGVEFAIFWAFLIFLLNYIPNVGSILATLFPALIALIQFDTILPFVLVLVIVGLIQLLVGNLIEPRMMGNSLNLSPLAVLLSLSVGALVWGVFGMIISVPFTVIVMIICSRFESTQPLAILLSADGKIMKLGTPQE